MNTDQIIETAIQGHASTRDAIRWAIQQEREACAKVCEDSIGAIFEFSDERVKETARNVCINLAKGIRARGNE